MHRSFILLFIGCSSVLARDPFQPLAGAACVQQLAPLAEWRLQGIIGREGNFRAWLVAPQGKKMSLSAERPFPLAGWRLQALTPRRVTLVVENSCSRQTHAFQLKGAAGDKDDGLVTGRWVFDASMGQ